MPDFEAQKRKEHPWGVGGTVPISSGVSFGTVMTPDSFDLQDRPKEPVRFS